MITLSLAGLPTSKKKNTFPKEFFNEIWLKVGEHEYIYITEITFKKIIPF